LASRGISPGPRRCHDDLGIGSRVMDQRDPCPNSASQADLHASPQ
jgi:hypothetical protein